MKDKVHHLLNEIIEKEADLLSPSGLVFSGFSITSEKSQRHGCFKAWTQHFSFEKELSMLTSQGLEKSSDLNYILLARVYSEENISSYKKDEIEKLIANNLIIDSGNFYSATNKGITVLSSYLALNRALNL